MNKNGNKLISLILSGMLMVILCSCEEIDNMESEIILKPIPETFFVTQDSVSFNFARIEWTASAIEDESEISYNVYIGGERLESGLESMVYDFTELDRFTSYEIKVEAISTEHQTKHSELFYFRTLDTPVPGEMRLELIEKDFEQVKLSWTNTDTTQEMTYTLYLDGTTLAEDLSLREYTITELTGNKFYTVSLVGVNQYNKSTWERIQIKTDRYPLPEEFTISLTDITDRTAQLEWTKGDDESLRYGIVLNGIRVVTEQNETSYTLRDLDADKQYTVQITATNEYEQSRKITTDFTSSEQEIRFNFEFEIENITHNSVTISWISTGEETEDLTYKIYSEEGRLLHQSQQADNQIQLSNLESESLYRYRIVATNNIDNSTREKIISFTSLPAPSLSDFTITVSNLTANSALLSWTESVASDGSRVVYDVRRSGGGSVARNLQTREFELTNLRGETTYEYRIVVNSESVYEPLEKTLSFTTTNYESPTDFALSIDDVSHSGAKLSWTASTLPSGGDVRYVVYLDGQSVANVYSTDSREYTFSRLNPASNYTAKVEAVSEHNKRNVQTLNFSSLTPDLQITTENITQRSINLSWNDGTTSRNAYQLFLNGNIMYRGNNTTYTLSGLNSNTNYQIKVIAVISNVQYEKTIQVRTETYPAVQDFSEQITNTLYHTATVDLSNFYEENSALPFVNNMKVLASLNGERTVNLGTEVQTYELTNLSAETDYSLSLRIRYPDGTTALEKDISFTTGINHPPVWNSELTTHQIGFSFAEFENNFATDPDGEDSRITYSYYMNGDPLLTNVAYIGGRGPGEVIRGPNERGNNILLKNMFSDTENNFYIVATDAQGNTSESNTVRFKTDVDAPAVFPIWAVVYEDEGVNVVAPFWDEIGALSSIKEIRVIWNIDGLELDQHYSGEVEYLAGRPSLFLRYEDFLENNADAEVTFKVRIYWIDQEAINVSESGVIDPDDPELRI